MKLKNLTPAELKGTRWEQFNEALDEYLLQVKQEKIFPLVNKFNPRESDKPNLRDLVARKGFKLIEADGYASSLEYFRRRAESLPTEILWALSDKCYKYVLKSFWLGGQTYSLEKDVDGYYYPRSLVSGTNSINVDSQALDQEEDIIYYYIDGIPVPNPPIKTFLPALFLDSFEFPNLDLDDQRDGSNHFLIDMKFKVVEDLNTFLTTNTSKALYETVGQIHRLREVPHYRPVIPFNVNIDGTVNSRQYVTYDFDELKESTMNSIYLQGNFSLAKYVQIGNNPYPVINSNITQVNVPIGILPISGIFDIISQSVSGIDLEYKILEYGRLSISGTDVLSYSEIAILDENFQAIAYVKFPEINMYDKMYTSVKVTATCV